MAMDLGSKGGKPGRASPNMNVTPLVDVVLVLLIIFMVITPLLAKQFWVNLPNKPDENQPPPPPSDDKDTPVVVTVTKKGDVMIYKTTVPWDQFEKKLSGVLRAKGQR